jgi:D-sedoheptulose 7-phosphate isomerase
MANPGIAPGIIQPRPKDGSIADFRSYFAKSNAVVGNLPFAAIERVADLLCQAYEEGRSVFLFGNGGSAALASHFACDLAKGTTTSEKNAKRLRALAITDNLALITAWANDTSYEQVFAEQLRNFVRPGDVAFGISGSGRSVNVLVALQAAREYGAVTVGLAGYQGGKMPEVCDICVVIPSDNMQIIEDLHLAVTHALFTVVRDRIQNSAGTTAQAVHHEVATPALQAR